MPTDSYAPIQCQRQPFRPTARRLAVSALSPRHLFHSFLNTREFLFLWYGVAGEGRDSCKKQESTESLRGGIRASLVVISIVRPRLKEIHPRHPPRAFPLGLLAPRCLVRANLLQTADARLCLGRGRSPLPSFAFLLAVIYWRLRYSLLFLIYFRFLFAVCAFGVQARTTPLHFFITDFVVSLSL